MMSIRRHLLSLPLLSLMAGAAAAAEGPQAPADAASDAAGSGIETVTITAQRRAEASQDVPISLQVVTSHEIEKLAATDLSTMNGYIPGLSVDGEQPTQPGYTLRGISVSDFGIGTDSPIGIYEDGVYTGKTGGALMLFNDIQRVEVLKGPQGTLFGRNSAAGAISVVTNEPGDTWEGDAKARFGSYNTQYYEAMLNAPLSDDVAARVSFVDNHTHGWLRDAASGLRYDRDGDYGVRVQLRWNAPYDTKVRLTYEMENLDQPARPAIGIVPLPPSPQTPPIPAQPSTWISPFGAPVENDVVDGVESRRFDGLTLRVEHEFGFASFTSITGWRQFNTFNREDQDGTNRINLYFDDVNIEANQSFSQEFTLAHKSALADWVGGVNYYYDRADQTSQLNLYTDSIDTVLNNTGLLPGGIYGPFSAGLAQAGVPISLLGDTWQENMINRGYARAYAAFGDVIWHLGGNWNLTTGVRFTHDERDFSWYNPPRIATQLDASLATLQEIGVPLPPFPFGQNIEFNTPISTNAPYRLNNSWNDWSPRVVLDYKPVPEVMFYLSGAKGYQAGGYNALSVGAKYDPETVRNYEFGIKSELFGRRLLLNASLYYYIYSNLQSLSLVQNGNGSLPEYEVTVSDQHATGVDFEAHWQASEGLRFNLVATYIDLTYKNYTAPDGTPLSGAPVGEPLWRVAGGLDYLWRDLFSGDLDFTLQDAYTGATRCNADSVAVGSCFSNANFSVGGAENRTDARIAWTSHTRAPVTLAFYVNNLFDKQYTTGIATISEQTLGTVFTNLTAPRFWGGELEVRF